MIIAQETTEDRLRKIFDDVLDIVATKNSDYGEAWKSQGWMGNLARVLSKTSRLKSLCWNDNSIGFKYESSLTETIEDTALDLIAITAFFILNRRDGNKWG